MGEIIVLEENGKVLENQKQVAWKKNKVIV